MEEWKKHPEYTTYYCSNLGNVRGPKGRILKSYCNSDGYHSITVYKDGIPINKRKARLVAQCFVPNNDNKPEVDHINRNRSDDRSENLRWVTDSENRMNTHNRYDEMYGICWEPKRKTYKISFTFNKKTTNIGRAKTLEEAKQKRDESLIQIL